MKWLLLLLPCLLLAQDARVTSDRQDLVPSALMPPARFEPPRLSVGVEFATNDVPLLVERTVSSNVVQTTVWYKDGKAQVTRTLLSATNVFTGILNVDTNAKPRILGWTATQ